jgi:3-phenylpropionate/trans-cinnamate dioxygenase ferredoxin reductase subunit
MQGNQMSKTCLIIGASHAAAQLAPSLRQEGWDGPIVLIGDESSAPYHRPPLSKAYLMGDKRADEILIRHPDLYARQGIELRLGARVESIDRQAKQVRLRGGESLSYDKLALCTGTRVRKVTLPGSELEGVHYLRSLEDVQGIKRYVGDNRQVVIVGGGYIGLETAAVLRKLGMQVTVLEMAPRVLARVTAPEISEFYARVHAEEGVRIETGVAVSGFEGDGHVAAVLCADGRRFAADMVVIGVGVMPNVELAEAANLAVDNGILVDEYARTADPDIVAVGDCTMHPLPLYGYVRLESVPNATEQAKVAAATLCGKQKAYTALPWFWSDQYDCKLQIAGLNQGYDQVVVRGDRQRTRSFALFYLREGHMIAADCVNRPQEFVVSKRMIAEQMKIDPGFLADESRPFKSLLPG